MKHTPARADRPSAQFAPDTVGAFAADLKKSPACLLEQLREAGVEKASADDRLSIQEKSQLLGHLQAAHGTGGERKRITLVKRDGGSQPTKQAKSSSSSNRVILVGGLGRIAYETAFSDQSNLLDGYRFLVRRLFASGSSFRDVCRRLHRMLKQIRREVSRVLRPIACLVRSFGSVERHGGAFFHALKVDGRNLP